jgi:MFS family permease
MPVVALPIFSDFRALDRRVYILAVARLVVTLGFSAVLPYLAVTLQQERGVPKLVVGLIWTAAGLAGGAMQWVAGEITDRAGRRRVLLSAMVIRSGNLAALGYEILHRGPILAIAVLCILNGVLRAFFDPVASAMVADLAPREHRVAAFSLQRIGLNIGWALGSMSLGFTHAAHLSYGQVFYISAGITLVAALAASGVDETNRRIPGAPSTRPAWRPADLILYWNDRRLRLFLAATFLFFLLQAQLYVPLSIYAASRLHLTLSGISHVYTANGWIVVLLQLPAFFYIRRTGTERVLVVGALAYAASYALCGLVTREWHLLLCVGAITLAEIISAPAQQTTATTLAPADRIGAYAGLYGLTQAAGQALGPTVGTLLLGILPDRLTWPLLGLFGVAAALLYRKANHCAHLQPPAATPVSPPLVV